MSDYLFPSFCVIDPCDGGAVWGREHVLTNYLYTVQEAHIPSSFLRLILFSQAK